MQRDGAVLWNDHFAKPKKPYKHVYFSKEFISHSNNSIIDEVQTKNWTEMAAVLIRKLEKPNQNFDLLSNQEALKKFSSVLYEKISFE